MLHVMCLSDVRSPHFYNYRGAKEMKGPAEAPAKRTASFMDEVALAFVCPAVFELLL